MIDNTINDDKTITGGMSHMRQSTLQAKQEEAT